MLYLSTTLPSLLGRFVRSVPVGLGRPEPARWHASPVRLLQEGRELGLCLGKCSPRGFALLGCSSSCAIALAAGPARSVVGCEGLLQPGTVLDDPVAERFVAAPPAGLVGLPEALLVMMAFEMLTRIPSWLGAHRRAHSQQPGQPATQESLGDRGSSSSRAFHCQLLPSCASAPQPV